MKDCTTAHQGVLISLVELSEETLTYIQTLVAITVYECALCINPFMVIGALPICLFDTDSVACMLTMLVSMQADTFHSA